MLQDNKVTHRGVGSARLACIRVIAVHDVPELVVHRLRMHTCLHVSTAGTQDEEMLIGAAGSSAARQIHMSDRQLHSDDLTLKSFGGGTCQQ
jgi:hypothetical protein